MGAPVAVYSGPPTSGTTAGHIKITITRFDGGTSSSMTYGSWNDLHYSARGEYPVTLPVPFSETRRRLERIARSMRKIVDDFKEAIRKAEIFAEVQKLAIAPLRRVLGPDPSQPGLAPRVLARRHDRQSVPSRTRRKRRVWER